MKVLITGAYGQLGSELKAASTGFEHLECIYTDYDTLDITDANAVMVFINNEAPEFVINCAAYTAVDKAENEEPKAWALNAAGPENLADACRKSGSHYIHISTDYVFDGWSCIPYTEDMATGPQGVYGKSKLAGEQLVLEMYPESLIIRTSWLYSMFGANFVKTMIRLGQEREVMRVVFDQTGTPTYARDLALALFQIVSETAANTSVWVPGIFHYSNEGVCSWYDFAKEIFHMAGIRCQVEPVESKDYPTPTRRPSYSVLNKGRIKAVYGLRIPHWKDSLKDCIERLQIYGL